MKQEEPVGEEGSDSEDDAEDSHVDLSWLPDPDKVFPSRVKGADNSDRSDVSHAGRSSDDSDDDGNSGDGDDSCEEEEQQNHR
jgi:hypothetical protein